VVTRLDALKKHKIPPNMMRISANTSLPKVIPLVGLETALLRIISALRGKVSLSGTDAAEFQALHGFAPFLRGRCSWWWSFIRCVFYLNDLTMSSPRSVARIKPSGSVNRWAPLRS